MQNDGEPWEQVFISANYLQFHDYFYILIKINKDFIVIPYITFQHPAEIVIEHHKQIPICQIEDKNKNEWKH